MPEVESKKKNPSQEWNWLFAIVLALASVLFLFGTVLTCNIKYTNDAGEKVKEYFNLNLVNLFQGSVMPTWPIWTFVVLVVLGILFIVLARFLKKQRDTFSILSVFSFLLAAALLFVFRELLAYYGEGNVDGYYVENFHGASIGWAIPAVAVCLALASAFDIGGTKYSSSNAVRDIAEDGILIAAAFVFNFIKLPIQAEGGSVNFQMLPLMIIALRHGPVQGFVCGGIVYGLLTCLTDGYGFATYPFDYLIGFGSVAVMGFFRNLILVPGQKGYSLKGELFLLLAGVLSTLVRFCGSTISSIAIYDYPLKDALIYNAVYIPVSGAIALAVLMAVYGPLCYVNTLYPAEPIIAAKQEEAK